MPRALHLRGHHTFEALPVLLEYETVVEHSSGMNDTSQGRQRSLYRLKRANCICTVCDVASDDEDLSARLFELRDDLLCRVGSTLAPGQCQMSRPASDQPLCNLESECAHPARD